MANRTEAGFDFCLSVMRSVITVMGTALIRAFAVAEMDPPGPLLLLDPQLREGIPDKVAEQTSHTAGAPLSVDWLHIKLPLVADIWSRTGFPEISDKLIEDKLIEYQKQFKLDKWTRSLTQFLKINPASVL